MNEADIPIDIHCFKLQDWLISRRIVPKNCETQILMIRNKILNAINDMPENEDLKKLLSGSHIHYFHCKSIVDILKQTEKDTKNLFGAYSSQRMKDWLEILKLYEKDNVYLYEASQILTRYQTYEVPGIWKQMDKCENQSEEALKKIKDLTRNENQLKQDHITLCQQLGIKGENLKEEFIQRLNELPKIYNESIKNIENIKDAVEIYEHFTKNIQCLPILKHVINKGNTTVYEYIHKEPPIRIEENPIDLHISAEQLSSTLSEENGNDDSGGIDFGTLSSDDNGNTTSSAELIDFGDENEVQLDTTGDIDWGDENTGLSDDKPAEIDFDVPLEEYDIVVEDTGMDGGVAKGENAYTILDSSIYRDKFIDELYELESFLKLRVYELNALETSSNIMMLSLLDNYSFASGKTATGNDLKCIQKLLNNIENLILNICNEQTQHLYHLKHSIKYADLLASKLKQKLIAIEKIQQTKNELQQRSIELLKQKQELKPIADDLIEQIKILQRSIENDISKRYKNRTVNLMGSLVK